MANTFSMLRCGRFTLSLDRPLIMGIVNVTPDSFSDGGHFFDAARAVAHGLELVAQGADLLDIGGESTRPGAVPVSEGEELDRVLPVLEGLREARVPLSVDTQKPGVMRAALAVGADMINDVNALLAPGALAAVAASDAAVCLMHKQGEPRTMQVNPHYDDVVGEVRAFLAQRIAAAQAAGIAKERIVIDPGFGFGKNLQHNLELLRQLQALLSLGVPVLAGLSRKSMLGSITGASVEARVHASVAAALLAARKGARILRVHDVRPTREALAVVAAVEGWGA
ncbi:dihydropteroate synthase [Thiobacter aerophilum]|uniref:Dihydropteroate synthase n=1 Tax=Thiobacter aerophilum TaxID=3121275 RepID=A0ABV0EK47_9BURK